jgi:polysaccharide biosynthesis/export protein
MKTIRYGSAQIVFFLGLICFIFFSGTTYGQPDAGGAKPPNISKQQLEQLEALGIDFSDTEAAVQKARDLGISETSIQDALKEYGLRSQIVPFPVEDELFPTEDAIEIPADETAEDGIAAEDVEMVESITEGDEEPGLYEGEGRWSGLKYYGYDIFETSAETAGPIEAGPVDPGYPVGSGDVLRLVVWGESEFQYELEVNKEGNIIIPQAGQIFVAGTRLENLRKTLKNYLSKFYSGLSNDPATTFMDLTLSGLRTNQIYIMGEIKTPGAHSVSSYATAFNVMYAVGGPNITGSLRDVRILREGKIFARIDMYDYILKGNSTDDRRLQNNDIVFVPSRISKVGIKGEILRPGIYETLKDESLNDLISLSGGLEQTAYSFRAQIDRIVPFEERRRGESDRMLIDVDMNEVMSNKKRIMLSDGDIVTIFPINDIIDNFVDIDGGGIERPGRYEFDGSIVTLSDLISEADGITSDAYITKADIIRTREDFTEVFMTVNLEDALRGSPDSDVKLERWDRVHVYSQSEMTEAPKITLGGFVRYPGTYPYYENTTVYDLLFKYSGLQDSLWLDRAFMGHGDIFRLREDGKTRYTLHFNLFDEWNKLTDSSVILEPEDEIVIYEKEVKEIKDHIVYLYGEVKYPGEYSWEDNMLLNDLLLKGGGFSQKAWFLDVDVSRVPLKGIKGENISETVSVKLYDGDEYPENPEEAIDKILDGKNPIMPYMLEAGDHVFVRANPEYKPIQVVSVSGEVRYPGNYSLLNENEKLSAILERAGGIKESSSIQGGQLFRDGERVFLDFSRIMRRRNSREDIVLLDGDHIVIPPKINTVMVVGEVFNPGYYIFVEGMTAKDYLHQSGGRMEDSGKVYITQPTGRTFQLGFLKNPKAMEGAVITVHAKPPEEGTKTDWSETVIETFSLLSGAMTIIYLAYTVSK